MGPADPVRRSRPWPALLSLVALPVAAHLAFSSLGFNPTDDGFILAASRRLLDGQVPHRDFISIRPAGSALLHAPWLLIGGSHTFWIARLAVWFEFALIAWAWTRLAARFTGRPSRPGEEILGTLVAFVLTSSTFPIMPWHTVDALALASGGLWLATSPSTARKSFGYALLGASALCRQNFLPAAPLAALLLGDRRRRCAGVASISPLLLYGALLLGTGALGPALLQLGSRAGLEEAGVRPYLTSPWAGFGVLLGALCGFLAPDRATQRDPADGRHSALSARALAWGLLLGAAFTMMSETGAYPQHASFMLFGAVLGQSLAFAGSRGWSDPAVRVGMLALTVAWCASISIGWSSPALAAGPLAASLMASAWPAGTQADGRRASIRRWALGVGVAAAFAAIGSAARLDVIYRDGPATELSQSLDGIWPGGAGLRTNPQTSALISDLARAVSRTRGRTYAVVADFPGYWVKADQRNPLSIDWPQSTELGTPRLKSRVIADLEALRGRGCILVQKVVTARAAERFDPIEDESYYFIPFYVRSHFQRTGATRWFDIYE